MSMIIRRTRGSLQFLADESSEREGLGRAVKELLAYEHKLIDGSFFTAVEFYVDLKLAPQDRLAQVKEISEVVDRCLKGRVTFQKQN